MTASTQPGQTSKGMIWAGRFLSGFAALFLTFDGVIHVMRIAPVVDAFAQLGVPISLSVGLGVLELSCLLIYLIPATSILGAVLLTGYLGGAIAIQLRIGAPLFSTALFPVYVGLMLWGGLYLRDPLVRSFMPVRR